jgi:ribulose-phosphate 3-epimerase
MISEPDKYIERFAKAGADMISVHVEAVPHLHRSLELIRSVGCRPGVVLNPGTSLPTLDEILPYTDFVLIMSVNPGFGGQKFINSCLQKISNLRKMIKDRDLNVSIEVDGGVDMRTAPLVTQAGAEWLVAGSAVFGAKSPGEAVQDMLKVASQPFSI